MIKEPMSMFRKLIVAALLASLPTFALAATVAVEATTADTGADPNTSDAFTPASGALLVVMVDYSGSVDPTPLLTSSNADTTFTLINHFVQGGAHSLATFVSDGGAVAESQTVTISTPADPISGSNIAVASVEGMTKFGTDAIRQYKNGDGFSAAETPSTAFDVAALTGNPTLVFIQNLSNPAGVTEPTDWTEGGDVGYASINFGLEWAYRNSGFTGTTVTWGSTSATTGSEVLIELDASAYDDIRMIACSRASTAAGIDLVVNTPVGTTDGDIMIGFYGINRTDGTNVTMSGFTQIAYKETSGGTHGTSTDALFWGLASSEGATQTFDFDSVTNGEGSASICTFRGVNQTTPLDVTYVEGSHYVEHSNTADPTPQPITTVTNLAWVLTASHYVSDIGIDWFNASSGFSKRTHVIIDNGGHEIQTQHKATAGTVTPGAVDAALTPSAGADWVSFTIALNPAADAVAVSYTAGPTRVAATNGHTIGGTLTGFGFGALVSYAVGVSPGDGLPSCAQIKLGQNDSSTAALLAASETWTTAVANDYPLAAANSIARMDVHVCGSDGTNNTSVTSFADADRSVRSGFAFITHTSVAATSPCDLDSSFNPDCAIGDVFEYEDDTNESADCNISFEADGDFVLTPVVAGDCDNRRSFEISYEDVSSDTTGLFTAPTAGNFTTDDTIYVNNVAPDCPIEPSAQVIVLTEDAVMTARDLAVIGSCSDFEGDAITYSVTGGTLPVGTALGGTGNKDWTGTPTTENEAGVLITITATDIAGATDTFQFTVYVVNTFTVPNLVGNTLAEAIDEILVAAPWRDTDVGLTVSALTCSVAPVGDILTQNPAAATQLAAFGAITVTLAKACVTTGTKNRLGIGIGIQ